MTCTVEDSPVDGAFELDSVHCSKAPVQTFILKVNAEGKNGNSRSTFQNILQTSKNIYVLYLTFTS